MPVTALAVAAAQAALAAEAASPVTTSSSQLTGNSIDGWDDEAAPEASKPQSVRVATSCGVAALPESRVPSLAVSARHCRPTAAAYAVHAGGHSVAGCDRALTQALPSAVCRAARGALSEGGLEISSAHAHRHPQSRLPGRSSPGCARWLQPVPRRLRQPTPRAGAGGCGGPSVPLQCNPAGPSWEEKSTPLAMGRSHGVHQSAKALCGEPRWKPLSANAPELMMRL